MWSESVGRNGDGQAGRIRNRADLEAGLAALLDSDPALAPVAAAAGELPLRLQAPGLGALAGVILSQHVSRASAQALIRRFSESFETVTPDAILAANDETYRRIGFTRAKQAALADAAEAVRTGALDLGGLGGLEAETAVAQLTSVRGVGPWTAEIYLMFCEGHADLFPAGDLALRKAAGSVLSLQMAPEQGELRLIAQRWSPWRSVAARLLWAHYAGPMAMGDAIPTGSGLA